jgi:hypothetical protein
MLESVMKKFLLLPRFDPLLSAIADSCHGISRTKDARKQKRGTQTYPSCVPLDYYRLASAHILLMLAYETW